jgi:tetratricopeptide (TPR) repeat protein
LYLTGNEKEAYTEIGSALDDEASQKSESACELRLLLSRVCIALDKNDEAVKRYKENIIFLDEGTPALIDHMTSRRKKMLAQSRYELGLLFLNEALENAIGRNQDKLKDATELFESAIQGLVHDSSDPVVGQCYLAWGTALEAIWDWKRLNVLADPKVNLNTIEEQVVNIYKQADSFFEDKKMPEYKKRSEEALENYKERKKSFALKGKSKNVHDIIRSVMEYDDMFELERHVYKGKATYDSFLKERHRIKTRDVPVFHVLQRWNSLTPILDKNNFKEETLQGIPSKGGGYFIDTGLHGIAIDPGFNFIENYNRNGFLFNQITHVIVTHAHNDHTTDLEPILSLIHAYNEQIKGDQYDTAFSTSIYRNIITRFPHITEDELEVITNELYGISSRIKKITLVITLSTLKKYINMLDINENADYAIEVVDKDFENIKIDENLSIYSIKAKHDDLISDNQSKGFIFAASDCCVFYTGDTGYSEEIGEGYANSLDLEIIKESGTRILLAHLGGFKHRERYNYYKLSSRKSSPTNSSGPKVGVESTEAKEAARAYYPNHLGRLGLIQLAYIMNPDYCVVSEFGEEFEGTVNGDSNKGYRAILCNILNDSFETWRKQQNLPRSPVFVPADIGFCFTLDALPKMGSISNVETDDAYGYLQEYNKDSTSFVEDKDGLMCANTIRDA